MKIVIFGTGAFYRNIKDNIPDSVEITGFLDNNSALWGACVDGVPVYAPEDVFDLAFDRIVLCSVKAPEMEDQLLELGVDRNSIWWWEKFCAIMYPESHQIFGEIPPPSNRGKNILIITQDLGYHGGGLVAVHAAQALRERGYSVILAAQTGNLKTIEEANRAGTPVVISPALFYLGRDSWPYLDRFDVVLVNVYPMIQCACEISRVKPVLWWMHEVSSVYDLEYPIYHRLYKESDLLNQIGRVYPVAVSEVAKENFNKYYPGVIQETLPYGIPDSGLGSKKAASNGKVIFSIVGGIEPRKGQRVFLDAIDLLSQEERERAEFWIIGGTPNTEYCDNVLKRAASIPEVKIRGIMTREEIARAYQEVDVCVCASLEECLPVVMVEGLMYGKLCITTDSSGMSQHIRDGENGFLIPTDDAEALAERLRWAIQNNVSETAENIRINARRTYEEYFTLEKFGDRLEQALSKTIKRYNQRS